jgi:small subunit ribosomal protein S20
MFRGSLTRWLPGCYGQRSVWSLFCLFPFFFEVVVPRIKSAKKRMRQAKTHTTLNRTHRSQLRSAIKKVRTAVAGAAQAAYDEAVKLIDRAGRKRLIHPNAAARQKSRLSKLAKAGGTK